MKSESQFKTEKLAVLIDADNANPNLIESLLREIAKYGTAHVKRIYGDWTNTQLTKWKIKLNEFAIQPMQQFGYTSGKNSTDSALIIDAMDLLYTQNFDGFCIVSSDSDFTRLASRIRESGLTVYGFGDKRTSQAFISACDKFIFTEILQNLEAHSNSSFSKIEFKDEKLASNSLSSVKEVKEAKKSEADLDLISLLKDAHEAIAEEDGWADLGPLGTQLNKLSPSFDSRNYGHRQLKGLVQATQLFEVKEIPSGKGKALRIKLKS